MKYILILCLAVSAISCNKKEEKSEPPLACPLLYEMEKLVINFEFTGALPVAPKLYLASEEISLCKDSHEQAFCIAKLETTGNKLSYYMFTHNRVEEHLAIELYDNIDLRLARTNEALPRMRTRPNDRCGSGYISETLIREEKSF